MRINIAIFFAFFSAAVPSQASIPAGLEQAADQAAAEQRDCDAAFLYLEAFQRSPKAGSPDRERYLRNAAEATDAANDINLALKLYRMRLELYPESDDVEFIRKRLAALSRVAETERSEVCRPPAAQCGNWLTSRNEDCDDGNEVDGDGCSSTCRPEECGNGIVDANEQCDDRNRRDGDGCSTVCQAEICGNGTKDDGEECDDGNDNGGDGCSSSCRTEFCGNGVVDVQEQCDDGNLAGGDGCSGRCRTEGCGNGVIDQGEDCDDGNDDDCSYDCRATVASAARAFQPEATTNETQAPPHDERTDLSVKSILSGTAIVDLVIGTGLVAADSYLALSYGMQRSALSSAADDARLGEDVDPEAVSDLYRAQVDAGNTWQEFGPRLFWSGCIVGSSSAALYFLSTTFSE